MEDLTAFTKGNVPRVPCERAIFVDEKQLPVGNSIHFKRIGIEGWLTEIGIQERKDFRKTRESEQQPVARRGVQKHRVHR